MKKFAALILAAIMMTAVLMLSLVGCKKSGVAPTDNQVTDGPLQPPEPPTPQEFDRCIVHDVTIDTRNSLITYWVDPTNYPTKLGTAETAIKVAWGSTVTIKLYERGQNKGEQTLIQEFPVVADDLGYFELPTENPLDENKLYFIKF